MKNPFIKMFLLFLAVNLLACSTLSQPTPTETPQAQPTFTRTKPFASETPGMTPISATPTETMPSTMDSPSALSEARLTIKCLEISSNLPENAVLRGEVFLMRGFVNGKGFSTDSDSKMNLQTRMLENVQKGGYIVSPNNDRLLYANSDLGADGKSIGYSLVIEDLEGKVLVNMPNRLGAWDSLYWLDNERVVIGSGGQPIVLNPFTKEFYGLHEWYAQSPGGLKTIQVWDVNGVFDSELDRLFYLQEDGTMLLWDLDKKQILAKIDPNGRYDPTDQPKWAQDNSQVVLAFTPSGSLDSGDEFFSVSHDGQISQLTQLNQYYPDVAIQKFSWSPDGRYIAFFFTDISKKDNPEQLAILDMATLGVTSYCDLSGTTFMANRPVWSPDGRMILIERLDADLSVKTILVDIVNEYAAQLAENLVPAGWMKAP